MSKDKGYNEGDEVQWNWSGSTAKGKVVSVYTQKRTLKIDGTEITREASADEPSYKIKQDNGSDVFKSHSEVKKAS